MSVVDLEMADDSESSDRFCASRNNWEPVSFERTDLVLEEASSSSSGSNEPSFYDNKFINKDYFSVPSTDPSNDPNQQHTGNINKVSLGVENVESPPSTIDWIEPSMPIQSCVIGTSEDEDSSSRSCSSDSREGSTEHILREKDAITSTGFDRDSYVCDYAAMLHDVPMDAIQESNIEPSEEINDVPSGEHGDDAPWRRCLGAWLSEAGRTSTFCSIALAAAVIGFVLVGSGWQRIRLQYQKLRCRFFPKGKGISQAMYHLVQIKDSSSKHRRIPFLKAQSCFSDVLNG